MKLIIELEFNGTEYGVKPIEVEGSIVNKIWDSSLLDIVMSYNQWHIGVQEHHLLFYGHKKEVCLKQNISIESHCME